jgi:predicted XRE-type DNA-binding protein
MSVDQAADLVYDTCMGRSVTITTPIPTLEEVGKRLKMSKARQQRLIEIVRGSGNGHMGSSIDDFLKAEGIFEEAQAEAIKEVVAWQLAEAMKQQKISKNKMAMLLKTSRTQVDRLLDPKNDITLGSLQRAAAMVGRRVSIELV